MISPTRLGQPVGQPCQRRARRGSSRPSWETFGRWMGNLQSAAAAGGASPETGISLATLQLLCEFLLEAHPRAKALALAYQSADRVAELVPIIRHYPYFQVDLAELWRIAVLTKDAAQVQELSEPVCNRIVAVVGKLCQAERLFSVLAACEAHTLRRLPETEALREAARLHGQMRWLAETIHYACGGDPVNFASLSAWHHRLALWEPLLQRLHQTLERHQNWLRGGAAASLGVWPPRPAGTTAAELEGALMELAAEMAQRLLAADGGSAAIEAAQSLTEAALAAGEASIVAVPPDVRDLVRYCHAHALLLLGNTEEALSHLIALAARCENGGNGASRLADWIGLPRERHAFIFHLLLSLPPICGQPATQLRIAQALLPSLPRCAEPPILEELTLADDGRKEASPHEPADGSAHDRLLQLLAEGRMGQGDFGGAYDCINEMCLPHRRRRQVLQLVRRMLEQERVEELCSYPWVSAGDRAAIEEALQVWATVKMAGTLPGHLPLYTWHLSRGSLRRAALALYSFARQAEADPAQSEAVYQALQMATNCLELAEPSDQWIVWAADPGANGPDVVSLAALRSDLVVAKARRLLAAPPPLVAQRQPGGVDGLLADLLRHGHLVPAMEIVWQMPAESSVRMVASFLLDSMLDARAVGADIERPWLEAVLASGSYSSAIPGHRGLPEDSVLRHFLEGLSGPHLAVLDEILRRPAIVPPDWLVEECCRQDCNRLLRRLGQGGEAHLQCIAALLSSHRGLRDQLTAGTLAFLQQITQP